MANKKLTLVNPNWQHDSKNFYGWTDESLQLTSEMVSHINHHLINDFCIILGNARALRRVTEDVIMGKKLDVIIERTQKSVDYVKSLQKLEKKVA